MASFSLPDLRGQVVIVTGGNAGLGFETIRQLCQHEQAPSRIYLAARSEAKAARALEDLERTCPAAKDIVRFLALDLASFASIKSAAADVLSRETRLDLLVNNAGIMMTPEGLTADGYEIQFGTNVLGPALFTQLLLPRLRQTATDHARRTRVVMLSSAAHARARRPRAEDEGYDWVELRTTMASSSTVQRYTLSKVADLQYARQLAAAETAAASGVDVVAVHPGMVATNLHHASTGTFLKPFLYAAIGLFATPVEKGARSQIWAAVHPDAQSGHYYGPVGKDEAGSKLSQDRKMQEALYRWVQGEIRDHVER